VEPPKEMLKKLLIRITPNLWGGVRKDVDFPRSIALVNWDNLGDFVLFSAVIRETKLNFPESKLIVVAQRENSALVDECHLVDKWIWVKGHHKAKAGMGHGKETSYWMKMVVTYFSLLFMGKRKIDLLIGPDWLLVDNPNQFMSNFLFVKGNKNLVRVKKAAISNIALYTDQTHQVTRMLSVLRMFGLKINSDEIETWVSPSSSINLNTTNKILISENPRVLISLGSGQARRSWPVKFVGEFVSRMIQRYPEVRIIVVGPKSCKTQETDSLFSNSVNVTNLIGKTDLSNIVALMESSNLLVSNDSGLIHIASTLKLSTVVVSSHPLDGDPWHLNSPNRYHPWKTSYSCLQPERALDGCTNSCESGEAHCIESISPDQVLSACGEFITGN
jgi:ADP-heptose:LPS heptosyltransferase